MCPAIVFGLRLLPWLKPSRSRPCAGISGSGLAGSWQCRFFIAYPLYYGPFQIACGFCVFLLWQGSNPLQQAKNASKRESNWTLAHTLRVQTAIIIIAFIGYAAWGCRSIALHVLSIGSEAFCIAVRVCMSTPVRPTVSTVAEQVTLLDGFNRR